jgi:hypothetical protein
MLALFTYTNLKKYFLAPTIIYVGSYFPVLLGSSRSSSCKLVVIIVSKRYYNIASKYEEVVRWRML